DYWRAPENPSPDQAGESGHSRNCRPPAAPCAPAVGPRPALALEAETLEEIVDLRLAADHLAAGPARIDHYRAIEQAVLQALALVPGRDVDEQLDQLRFELLRQVDHPGDHLGR